MSVRWSEKQLAAHLAKASNPRKEAQPAPGGIQEGAFKKPKSTGGIKGTGGTVIEAVRQSRFQGVYDPTSRRLTLTFEGARTLPPNALLKLAPFQRIAYRRAWHDLVQWAVVAAMAPHRLGLSAAGFPLKRFGVHALRQSKWMCDKDALGLNFKYAIDGLKHAGVIVDDDWTRFVDFDPTQRKGEHVVQLLVWEIEESDEKR